LSCSTAGEQDDNGEQSGGSDSGERMSTVDAEPPRKDARAPRGSGAAPISTPPLVAAGNARRIAAASR
jgi:hypothetical protein